MRGAENIRIESARSSDAPALASLPANGRYWWRRMSRDDRELVNAFLLQARLIGERLDRAMVDMNVALENTDGIARIRLEGAVQKVDDSLREVRLLAAMHLRLGAEHAGRQSG